MNTTADKRLFAAPLLALGMTALLTLAGCADNGGIKPQAA
ncbi:hypothetical protein PMI16_03449, partial [Herbaspirillum sp. CF444]